MMIEDGRKWTDEERRWWDDRWKIAAQLDYQRTKEMSEFERLESVGTLMEAVYQFGWDARMHGHENADRDLWREYRERCNGRRG